VHISADGTFHAVGKNGNVLESVKSVEVPKTKLREKKDLKKK